MNAMHREVSKDAGVDSPLGKKTVDSEGAPISGVRMDVSKAYAGVPALLQKVINENDTRPGRRSSIESSRFMPTLTIPWRAWTGDRFAAELQAQVKSGKKLLFKPNLVAPTVIDHVTHGGGWVLPLYRMAFHCRLDAVVPRQA